MRGEVLSLTDTGGLISGDDGARYTFTASDASGPVKAGDRVDFVGADGVAVDIMVLAGSSGGFAGMSPVSDAPMQGFDFGSALFSFNGRLRRQNFWIGWLILLGVGVVLGWIPFLGAVLSILLIWPNLAIAVKRLHDMGLSGWIVAIPWVINIVGTAAAVVAVGASAVTNAAALEAEDPAAIMALIGPMFGIIGILLLLNLAFLLWIGVSDSQPGANRFGPNPKGR